MSQQVVETKVAAGSAASIVTGLLTWALTTYIPSWHSGIPAGLQAFIPVAASVLIGTYAAWKAPHTHRPDLAPPAAPQRVSPPDPVPPA